MSADTLIIAPSSFLPVLRVNRQQAGARVHAGVLVRVVVRSTPPPESRGRSSLLIRAADRPSRISHRFPPVVVLPPGVVKSSRSDPLSYPPTIRTTSKEISRLTGASTYPVAIFDTGEIQYRSPVPTAYHRMVLRCLCRRSWKHCLYIHAKRGSGACAGTAGSRRVSIPFLDRLIPPKGWRQLQQLVPSARAHRIQRPSLLWRQFHKSPVIGVGMALPHSTFVNNIQFYQHGLRCQNGYSRLESDNPRIYGFRSSPAASETSGSSGCSWLIFKFLVNPDHVHPSQLSHRRPDKITLGHGAPNCSGERIKKRNLVAGNIGYFLVGII